MAPNEEKVGRDNKMYVDDAMWDLTVCLLVATANHLQDIVYYYIKCLNIVLAS